MVTRRAGQHLTAALTCAATFTACDNRLHIGSVDTVPPTVFDHAAAPPAVDAGADAPEIGPLGPVEWWTGYIENYHFASGSDAIKLSFANDEAGHVVGAFVFGNGIPPGPATDPTIGYPYSSGSVGAFLFEGLTYHIRSPATIAPSILGRRLLASVSSYEIYESWCGLQPPFPGSSLCLPSDWATFCPTENSCELTNPVTKEKVSVSQAKDSMCVSYRACLCTVASGCHANLDEVVGAAFDIVLADLTGEGSAGVGPNLRVILAKDQ